MTRRRKFIPTIFFLLGIFILAGGLFWISSRKQPETGPVFVNQGSISVWGPVRITLPAGDDDQAVAYDFAIHPDLPFTVLNDEKSIEIWFTQPAKAGTTYTLQIIPSENQVISHTFQWEFSPRPPAVIFMLQDKTGADLWIVSVENGEKIQLSFTNGTIQDYTVSQDGDEIVFSVTNNLSGTDLWAMDRNGENMRQIVDCEKSICSDPSFLRHNEGFAFIKSSHEPGSEPVSQILLYENGHSETKILYEQTGRPVSDLNWSPDGTILAFIDENKSQMMFIKRDSQTVLSVNCLASETGGWSSDGSQMTFACVETLEKNPCKELRSVNPLTMEITLSPMFAILEQRDYSPPAWSSDGKWIIFGERCYSDRPTRQLWLVDAETFSGARITNEDLYNFANYHWDPTSTMLVLQRFEMGSATAAPDVLLWRLSTEELELLMEGGHSPNWLP